MKKNHHCNVLTVSGCGILIEGPSGSGKSSLTFGLLEKSSKAELENAFVCDDQAMLVNESGTLIASAPVMTGGKIELRGYGIIDHPHLESCSISLVARMVGEGQVPRMPHLESTELFGVELPLIKIPMRHEQASVRIVFAWLKDNGYLD
ncbi:MAG: HPr kinase/phosphorylase [Rhizobiaceae bacterium]